MKRIILKIKMLIDKRGTTNSKLANAIGLTRQSVSDMMNGKTAISIKNLEKIAKHFEVPMVHFFQDGDEKPALSAASEPHTEYGNLHEQLKSENTQLKDQIKFLQHIIDKDYK